MTFKDESTHLLGKMLNAFKNKPRETPPHLQIGATFSDLIGNTLLESVYLKQDFYFKKRVEYGENVNVRIEIVALKDKRIEMKTQILNKGGEVLVDGKSTVLYDNMQV